MQVQQAMLRQNSVIEIYSKRGCWSTAVALAVKKNMNLLLLVNSSKAEEMLCPKIMLCEMLLSDKSLVNVFFLSLSEKVYYHSVYKSRSYLHLSPPQKKPNNFYCQRELCDDRKQFCYKLRNELMLIWILQSAICKQLCRKD